MGQLLARVQIASVCPAGSIKNDFVRCYRCDGALTLRVYPRSGKIRTAGRRSVGAFFAATTK